MDNVQEVGQLIEWGVKENDEIKESTRASYSGVYTFVSFDVVNSTYYKSINEKWIELIKLFYNSSILNMQRISFNLWKYIGDEVLFYRKITNEEDIVCIPKQVIESMRCIREQLYTEFHESQGLIDIKATLWIAQVDYVDFVASEERKREGIHDRTVKNILIKTHREYSGSEGQPVYYDFLGPGIDTGFRISSDSRKNQLVVSAEFFCLHNLISEKLEKVPMLESLESHYRIIDLKVLKGIWHGRKYPIILYRLDWTKDDVFEYDEEDTIANEELFSLNGKEKVRFLARIFEELGKTKEIKTYLEIISNSDSSDMNKERLESPVDVHIAALVFSSNRRVLLMKRGQEKSNSDKFDFGCTNISYSKTIKETLEEYYGDYFAKNSNAKIEIFCSGSEHPTPFASYVYEQNDFKKVNGILFIAYIDKKHDEIEVSVPSGYESFKWLEITEEDIQPKLGDDVPLFPEGAQNILRAYDELKKIRAFI